MGFYPKGKRGTVRGVAKMNSMGSSIKLFRAMRGIGADKHSITEVIAYHNNWQRQELKAKYKYVYKKDLDKVLEEELSSAFGKLVQALVATPEDFVLDCIHRAITPQKSAGKKLVRRLSLLFSNGLGKDEYVLIDLLGFKSNAYLEEVKKAYKAKFKEDLEDKISTEGNLLSPGFCNIIQDVLACDRDESDEIDPDQIEEDINDLEDADTTEVALQTIFQERSYPYIRKLAVDYRKKVGKTLSAMIEENMKMSQEQKGAFEAIFQKIRNEHLYYAERLRVSIDGMGRDDDALIRMVVLRSELDLLDIMDAYKDKYGIELGTNVANETSGEYKEMLARIIRVPDGEEPAMSDPSDVTMDAEEMESLKLDDASLQALLNGDDVSAEDGAGEEAEPEDD